MDEGNYLARDIVRALRQIGLRAVFTTHMHELAAETQAINEETPGDSTVFSLVALRPDGHLQPDQGYSYRIQPGPPAATLSISPPNMASAMNSCRR